jgi:prophage regulatory protein
MAVSELGVPTTPSTEDGLWKLNQVLRFVQLGRTRWLAGVQRGEFPAPVRLSPRRIAWRSSDIRQFVDGLHDRQVNGA